MNKIVSNLKFYSSILLKKFDDITRLLIKKSIFHIPITIFTRIVHHSLFILHIAITIFTRTVHHSV